MGPAIIRIDNIYMHCIKETCFLRSGLNHNAMYFIPNAYMSTCLIDSKYKDWWIKRCQWQGLNWNVHFKRPIIFMAGIQKILGCKLNKNYRQNSSMIPLINFIWYLYLVFTEMNIFRYIINERLFFCRF